MPEMVNAIPNVVRLHNRVGQTRELFLESKIGCHLFFAGWCRKWLVKKGLESSDFMESVEWNTLGKSFFATRLHVTIVPKWPILSTSIHVSVDKLRPCKTADPGIF